MKNVRFIEEAATRGVQIICMQEVFTTPYFCAEQEPRWYEAVEKIPDGPTVKLMQKIAKKHGMVVIVPIYEEEITGVYYNTAAVIDADGKYLGHTWTTPEFRNGRPSGLAVTRAGQLLVCDSHYNTLRVYDAEGKELFTRGGVAGTELGQFGYISDAVEDTEGSWDVSEFGLNERITRMDPAGKCIATFGEPGNGPHRDGILQVNYPWRQFQGHQPAVRRECHPAWRSWTFAR